MKKVTKEVFMYSLAALITLCFFTTLTMVIFVDIPQRNVDSVNILLGISGTGFIQVLTFFFGSSKGSADKTEMLHKAKEDKKD